MLDRFPGNAASGAALASLSIVSCVKKDPGSFDLVDSTPIVVPAPPPTCLGTYEISLPASVCKAELWEGVQPGQAWSGVVMGTTYDVARGCSFGIGEQGSFAVVFFAVSEHAAGVTAACKLEGCSDIAIRFAPTDNPAPADVYAQWDSTRSLQIPVYPAVVREDGSAIVATMLDLPCRTGVWPGAGLTWEQGARVEFGPERAREVVGEFCAVVDRLSAKYLADSSRTWMDLPKKGAACIRAKEALEQGADPLDVVAGLADDVAD